MQSGSEIKMSRVANGTDEPVVQLKDKFKASGGLIRYCKDRVLQAKVAASDLLQTASKQNNTFVS